MNRFTAIVPAMLLATACQSPSEEGETGPTPAFDKIEEGEVVHFTGTEPFWGGEVSGGELRYSTPENVDGIRLAVERFAGLNGVSFSGRVESGSFDLMITPSQCSDGMSDRTYPYVATLMLAGEKREGCAWTDRQPYEGPAQP